MNKKWGAFSREYVTKFMKFFFDKKGSWYRLIFSFLIFYWIIQNVFFPSHVTFIFRRVTFLFAHLRGNACLSCFIKLGCLMEIFFLTWITNIQKRSKYFWILCQKRSWHNFAYLASDIIVKVVMWESIWHTHDISRKYFNTARNVPWGSH